MCARLVTCYHPPTEINFSSLKHHFVLGTMMKNEFLRGVMKCHDICDDDECSLLLV